MQLPGWSTDLQAGKEKLAERYADLEKRVLNECQSLANSGFTDKRLVANAYEKFEEAFLLLRKSLRLDAGTDQREYGKVHKAGEMPPGFTPPTDTRTNVGDYDADGNLKLTRSDEQPLPRRREHGREPHHDDGDAE